MDTYYVTKYNYGKYSECLCFDCRVWLDGIYSKDAKSKELVMGKCSHHSEQEPLDPIY